MSALLVGGASTFVSCKDYDGDQAAVTNAELDVLRKYVNENCPKLEEAIKALQTAVGENKGNIGTINGKLDGITTDITKLQEDLTALKEQVDGITPGGGCDCGDLVERVSKLEEMKATVTALAELLDSKDALVKLAEMQSTWGEDFKNVVVRSELANYVSWEDIQNSVWPNAEAMFEKKADMQKDVKAIIDSITKANAENFTTYADLVAAFDKVPAKLQEIDNQLILLTGFIDNLQVQLNEMVTGVNVDMVWNPYFGMINTPFGLNSNVIVGFVGDEIPAEDLAEFGVEGAKDHNGLATSGIGGKIFFTINPSNVDAKGLKFNLVGRDGTEAPGFQLSPIVKDYTKVTTIPTRAGAVNGYVAEVAITDGDKALINVNKDELKDVAKNVLGKLKGQNSLNIMDAVKAIYNTAANAVPQYYALQTEYDYTDYNGVPNTKAYVSDYNIAAVTVKPLSYETLKGKGYTFKSIPQLQEILGIDLADYRFEWKDIEDIEDMEQDITLQIPDANSVTIDGSKINPKFMFDNGKLEVVTKIDKVTDPVTGAITDVTVGDTEVKVLDGFVKISDMDLGNAKVAIGTKDTTITVTVKMDKFNSMIHDINGQVGGMLGKVDGIVDQIQNGFDKVNSGVIARLNKVIAKVNKITENPNALLQPVMFYSDANGAGRMSESEYVPTRFNLNGQSEGSIILAPTSYTAEMLAPAYIKSIKVIDGTGASVEKDGKLYKFTAKAGKYTIEYKAMDYYGAIRTKKCYVEVK